jgi:hypothetical protein
MRGDEKTPVSILKGRVENNFDGHMSGTEAHIGILNASPPPTYFHDISRLPVQKQESKRTSHLRSCVRSVSGSGASGLC